MNKENLVDLRHWAETVVLDKIVIQTKTTKKGEFVKKVRFETSKGNITFNATKKETVMETEGALTKEKEITIDVTFEELLKNYPWLIELHKLVEQGPQDIIISYTEKDFQFDNGDVKRYMFMSKRDFETVYNKEIFSDNERELDQLNRRDSN